MSTELQREESFRTALRNQRRRLSATQNQKTQNGLKVPGESNLLPHNRIKDDLSTNGDSKQSSPDIRESILLSHTGIRDDLSTNGDSKQSTPDIRLEFWDIDSMSPMSSFAGSPPISRSPSPILVGSPIPRSPSPRSPIPQNSPLLCPHTVSTTVKRARSFNKDLRKARSFRAAREKSCSRNNSQVSSRNVSPCPTKEILGDQEVSFTIKQSMGARRGWKILADHGEVMDATALKTVAGMIKDMEYQGFTVPERITIKIPRL